MRVLIFFLTLFISESLNAQGNNWSKGALITEDSFISSCKVDKEDNLYFGGGGKDTLISNDFDFKTLRGKYKILCGKYRKDGTFIWASEDGECDFIDMCKVAYDETGNL